MPETRVAKALILAPRGRDAGLAASLLEQAGLQSKICVDLGEFERAVTDEALVAVVTEEALAGGDLRGLSGRLENQPPWSDLPFIVLTHRGGGPERNPGAGRLSELLRNVSFLERPFHPTTFVSLARTALRGRQRQFEARARMEELHEGEERLRTALLAGQLGSWELDLATGALTVSATCKTVFGRRPDDPFTYDDLMEGVHPIDRERMKRTVARSIETGDDYAIEYRTLWPDGSTHWAEIRARFVNDRRRGKSRLVGVSSDITARKAAESALQHVNETLEARVEARRLELESAHRAVLAEISQRERAEEQLRQAQKMEMIGQLTGGVAHDFNNLLMAVLGNLDLLRKHAPEDAKTRRLIDGAMQGAQRGAALTQRLLAFARRQELKVEPKALSELVHGMTDLLERSVGSNVELHFEFEEDLPPALMDVNQVELALLNLAVNARDAMPDGGALTIAAVRAAAGEGPAGGPYVKLVVSDTGQGMSAATLAKATEPFFSTKEVGKGTGLGLSMIHGLAVQLNGALRLTSEVGRGTRAELVLPAGTASATRENAMAEATERPVGDRADGFGRATILTVDDDALIAMSTVDMLEDLGHEVIEANSGAQALAILQSGRRIDLLITDYSMPKMTGAQLAKAALELRPGLPILLATGYAELPPGADIDLPRLGKPYQQSQLALEIGKLLAR